MTLVLARPSDGWQSPTSSKISRFGAALGCEVALLPRPLPIDVAHRITATSVSGTPTYGAGANGPERIYSSAADYLNASGAVNPINGYWWLMIGRLSSVGTWSGIVARNRDTSTASGWAWQRESSNNVLRVTHAGLSVSISTIDDLLDGANHVFIGTWDKSSVSLFRDGVRVRNGAFTTAPDYTSGNGNFRLFSSRDVSLSSGAWSLFAFGSRGLSDGEAVALSENPGRVLEPRRIFVPASVAATTYTLSNATYVPGSITASGVTPRVTVTVA